MALVACRSFEKKYMCATQIIEVSPIPIIDAHSNP